MGDRRPLVAGLKPTAEVNPGLEKQFVYGQMAEAKEPAKSPQAATESREKNGANSVSRVPLTTRIRADYGVALKRASLERQLANQHPNTVQDILEAALGPWLRDNGYIP